MLNIIKTPIDEIEDPNILGAYWREIAFPNDDKLSGDFVLYYTEDWLNGEAHALLYEYFDYLNDEQYAESDCPSFAYNSKLGLWVAWLDADMVFYDEKNDIFVWNNSDHWEFF